MKVLVTGGAGYIGSFTVRALHAAGHQVVIVDDLSAGHRAAVEEVEAELYELDLVHDDLSLPLIGCDAVVHFAGKALVPESVREPALYYQVNTIGTFRLLEAMRAHGVRRFVFSSTCATYGVPGEVPIVEEHPQAPVTAYGASKLAVEYMLRDYARAYGVQAAALRYFNAAGAASDGSIGEHHEPETHLIPLVLRAAQTGRPVKIFGSDYPTFDGSCVRDYIHVEDLARAHVLAVESLEASGAEPSYCAYNLGTGVGSSVREVIETARRICGVDLPAEEAPRRAGDPPALVARPDRAREALGFETERTLEDIIASAWAWHSTHPDGYAG
jgi:UDP-glucose-4-epimerase GalE